MPLTSSLGAIDTSVTSPDAGRVDQLEGHLDAVGVGIVHDELALTDQGLGLRIELPGVGRIGDLLEADSDVHDVRLFLTGVAFHQCACCCS